MLKSTDLAAVVATGLALVLSGCGNAAVDETAPSAFAVVDVGGDGPSGTSANIERARVTADGDLQVMVEGGACQYPSRLQVTETRDEVSVDVQVKSLDGDCTQQIVPWFVPIQLESALAGRDVLSGTQKILITDCAVQPSEKICTEVTGSGS